MGTNGCCLRLDSVPATTILSVTGIECCGDTWIDGRLQRRGLAGLVGRHKRRTQFLETFPALGPAADEVFTKLYESDVRDAPRPSRTCPKSGGDFTARGKMAYHDPRPARCAGFPPTILPACLSFPPLPSIRSQWLSQLAGGRRSLHPVRGPVSSAEPIQPGTQTQFVYSERAFVSPLKVSMKVRQYV